MPRVPRHRSQAGKDRGLTPDHDLQRQSAVAGRLLREEQRHAVPDQVRPGPSDQGTPGAGCARSGRPNKSQNANQLPELPPAPCGRSASLARQRHETGNAVLQHLSQSNDWSGAVMFAMRLNSTRRLMTWISWIALAALMVSLAPTAQASKDKKKKDVAHQPQKPLIDTSKLVWPAPPDIARIRYLTLLEGEEKPVEPNRKKAKKKQGWMDRLAGVEFQDYTQPVLVHYLAKPYGVAVDSKGRVYTADTYVGAVFIFDLEAKRVDFIRNGADARFRTIIGLAIDDNDRLFVTDAGLHQVSVFNASHKLEATFGTDDLSRPGGTAIDTENRFLYVVDTQKERVAVFDADSYKLLRTIGGPGKTENDDDPGTFAKPTNVAVDADGNVYVADTINNRIQIFDADGKFISMFGKAGDGVGY